MSHIAPESDRPDRLADIWKRGLVFILLCAGLGIVVSSDALHSMLLRLLAAAETIIAAHPVWGTLFIVVFAAVAAMLAFVSSAVIVPVTVYTWGEPLSMLLLWAGWTLGGICAYGVGRFLGRPVVTFLISGSALARFEDRFSTHAPFGLVLLFQLALPSEVPGYVLGIVRYKFAKFVVALGLAEFPFAVTTVYLGASFVERRMFVLLGVGAATLLFSAWAFYQLQKRLAAQATPYRKEVR